MTTEATPAALARVRLDNTRLHIVRVVQWKGRDWILGLGPDRDGRVREIFVDGVKTGADIEAWADKSCMMVSKLLQLGETAETLRGWLGGVSRARGPMDEPDLVDVILAEAITAEGQDGEAWREAWLCADGKHPLQLAGRTDA